MNLSWHPGHGIKQINGHYICPDFSLHIKSASKVMDEWLYVYFFSQ